MRKYWGFTVLLRGSDRKTEAVYKRALRGLSPSRGREYFAEFNPEPVEGEELCLVTRDRSLPPEPTFKIF